MKQSLIIGVSLLTLGAAGVSPGIAISPVAAQSVVAQTASVQTKTFAIENMTCALCPVTVKSAIEGVNGVQSAAMDFGAKTATVVFDSAVATPEAIATASTDAGYPATAQN
jgi:mercuric ion binding protein